MPRERKYEVADRSEQVEALVAKVASKGFTPLQDHFGDWVTERSAPEGLSAKALDAFRLGTKYALVLRMEHQMSPENHEFKAEGRAARAQEADAKPKRAPKAQPDEDEAPAPKRKVGRPRKTEAEPAEDEAPARPARRTRTRAAAADKGADEVSAKPTRRPAASGKPGRPRRGSAQAEF